MIEFDQQTRARFEELRASYPQSRSALLGALRLLQEHTGHITSEGIEYVAALLDLTPAQVQSSASFYSMFRFHPEGRRQIEVCTNLACQLRGADEVLAGLCRGLGLEPGETTADGSASVHRVECLAACGGAPAVQVNGRFVEGVSLQDLDAILSGRIETRSFDWPRSPGEPVLLRNAFRPNSTRLTTYREHGGYQALERALALPPDEVVEIVKRAQLRGRGGAGFPTGLKWSFLAKEEPRYLCVNADEGEPGTFKDRLLMERDPHQLIEGCLIAAHAIRAQACYVYIRGEFHEVYQILAGALREAREAGLVGRNILGSGVSCEIVIHRGAGSYECGEETALIESLEGQRGQPRLKPPFPAARGVYGQPTIVNNVETIVCLPLILERGAEWFAAYGTEKNGGPKLYCVSGHVVRPGVYEAPMGRITLRELIFDERYGGGMLGGRRLKAVSPGGSSTPLLKADEIDVALDFDSVARAGSMLGSAGAMVMDETTCMVAVAERLMYFYKHESCGKCTPCREGTGVLLRLLARVEAGQGSERDLDQIAGTCDAIAGKTLCPFGDAAIAPVQSTLAKFRAEYLYHVQHGSCWRQKGRTFEEAAR